MIAWQHIWFDCNEAIPSAWQLEPTVSKKYEEEQQKTKIGVTASANSKHIFHIVYIFDIVRCMKTSFMSHAHLPQGNSNGESTAAIERNREKKRKKQTDRQARVYE